MGTLIQWFFLLIGCLLASSCGIFGACLGGMIIWLFALCDPEDLEFWKKNEESVEDY